MGVLARDLPPLPQASRLEKQRILDEFCRVAGYHGSQPCASSTAHCPPGAPGTPAAAADVRAPVIPVLAAIWRAAGYPWRSASALLPLCCRGRAPLRSRQPSKPNSSAESPPDGPTAAAYRRPGATGRYGARSGHPFEAAHSLRPTGGTSRSRVHRIDRVPTAGSRATGSSRTPEPHGHPHHLGRDPGGPGPGSTPCSRPWSQATDAPLPAPGDRLRQRLEFINAHRVRYCQHHAIQFTRGRPYKKDDNAHIEQKNWTHVRKLWGISGTTRPRRWPPERALSARAAALPESVPAVRCWRSPNQ